MITTEEAKTCFRGLLGVADFHQGARKQAVERGNIGYQIQ